MPERLVCRTAVVAGLAWLLTAGSAAAADKATLKGSRPAWADAKHLVKPADPAGAVNFRVYLGWQDGAEALARAVSDPRSASYRQYLTPAQFRNRFAPSETQVADVRSWLSRQGFTVTYTPANRHYVAAEGTVAQASAAFGTSFGTYAVNGKSVRSPSTDVSVPDSLAGAVTGVVGLDDSAEFVASDRAANTNAPPSAGFRNAPPLSDYWAQKFSPYAFPAGFRDLALPSVPWTVKGYTPAQIKGAYGISGAYNGAGQTVAIIDAYASPTILQDVNQWSRNRGLPTMNASQFSQVVAPGTYKRPQNPRQDPQGWYGEETLDVEAVHGMAPGANIVYVGAPNNYQDLDAALNHVVDRHLAQIVTNSYGWNGELLPRGFIKPLQRHAHAGGRRGHRRLLLLRRQRRRDERPRLRVDGLPGIEPVGHRGRRHEPRRQRGQHARRGDRMGDERLRCATPPRSRARARPGSTARAAASARCSPSRRTSRRCNISGRGVPDVAAVGDPQTGLLVGQTQTFPDGAYYDEYRIGGTSLASPIFAGIMALSDQRAGAPHGFANPAFYAAPGRLL